MKISELLLKNEPMLSFEVFPPKTDDAYDTVKYATEHIAALNPDFMSVTYGAGGGTSKYTLDIAKKNKGTIRGADDGTSYLCFLYQGDCA